jgi:hypothetical protein
VLLSGAALTSYTAGFGSVGQRPAASECRFEQPTVLQTAPLCGHRAERPSRLKRSAGQLRYAELDDLYASVGHERYSKPCFRVAL